MIIYIFSYTNFSAISTMPDINAHVKIMAPLCEERNHCGMDCEYCMDAECIKGACYCYDCRLRPRPPPSKIFDISN